MIYLQIITAIAAGIVLLYLGTVIALLAVMAAVSGVRRVGVFWKGRAA